MKVLPLPLRRLCSIYPLSTMTVILSNTRPPLQDVAKLGAKASQIYGILWESAVMDVRYDKRKHLDWKLRRDCGGLTFWSKKALAGHTHSHRTTVAKAIDALLDAGFITVVGLMRSSNGSPHHIYRVIHPDDLEAHRHTISLFNEPPSVRWKNYGMSHSKDTIYKWSDEPSDFTDLWSDDSLGLAATEIDDSLVGDLVVA
mgnify:CR=1 FL=1|jgi:hypothetical protein